MHKFRHRSFSATPVYQIQWNNAMNRPLCRSRSFKVTDFGTNRKLIYDFLLVINTNLTSYLAPFPSYGWLLVKFSLARAEFLTLTLTLRWFPANIAISDISPKTRYLGLHFHCRKYCCVFNHFYVIRSEFGKITRRLGLLRRSRSSKVTEFGTNRKLICDFLLVINTNLLPIFHRYQVMAD